MVRRVEVDVGVTPTPPPMYDGMLHLHALFAVMRGTYYWRWHLVTTETDLCRTRGRCKKYRITNAGMPQQAVPQRV